MPRVATSPIGCRFRRHRAHTQEGLPLRTALILATFLSLVAGCDPGFEFSGRVEDAKTGKPLEMVHALLNCESKFAEAMTNSRGLFQKRRIGWCPGDCVVEISADGYAPLSIPVMEVCEKRPSHLDDACLTVRVDVRLEPTRENPAPPLE